MRYVLIRSLVAVLILGSTTPAIYAAPYNKGIKLNTFFRVTSAPIVSFLEKYGIQLSDLIGSADLKTEQNKDLTPLINALKPQDFPYAFFYTNEFMFTKRFPGIAAIKVDTAAWMALIKIGAEDNLKGQAKIRGRFYAVPREDMMMEILSDGILLLPSDQADTMPEVKSIRELHDAITADMGIKTDDGVFLEYHEKSAFTDAGERLKALLGNQARQNKMAPAHIAMMENILKRMMRNPFLKATLSTKQTALRIDIKDGIAITAEYTLGDISHKEAFVATLTSMQVLGSVGMTIGMAAWEAAAGKKSGANERTKIGMDLLEKFALSFEKIRITTQGDKVTFAWPWVNGNDLAPAMKLAKVALEKKKAETKDQQRVEAVRDEACAALTSKDLEKFKVKTMAYAEALPPEEHKIWRIRQTCNDGTGILLNALEFGGEEVFLKLVIRLKYHVGSPPMENAKGKGYLHIAVEKRLNKALKQILADGIVINNPDKSGKTPLIYAIERKNAAALKLMLDGGVKVMSDEDITLAKKTTTAAEASGDEKIKEMVANALKNERAFRKKHATQI